MRRVHEDPWKLAPSVQESDPVYITVIGNSGSGKSSLLKEIAALLSVHKEHLIAIDEHSIHHPYLERLFFNPLDFALELQALFMLQRVTVVKHWLANNYSVVMERSHLDDIIFAAHLLQCGYIVDEEYSIYERLWIVLSKRVRQPDLIFFLDVRPQESIRRINSDEQNQRRPREFPDELTKETWITSWHALYQRRVTELESEGLKIIRSRPDENPQDLALRGLRSLGY